MNLREAAQQALEAMETDPGSFADWLRTMRAARTALRAALSEDVPETNFGNMAQEVDSKESNHIADTGKTSDQSEDARGMVATSRESRQVEPVATINKMETVEPVAWMRPNRGHICFHKYPEYVPLYTAPPKRKPLTDEEISKIWRAAHGIGGEE